MLPHFSPSQPSTSYRSTPSSHKQSKPSAQRAKAKVQAKSSGSSSKRRSIKNWVQNGLDLAGNVPGPLGAVSDGVNALIYLADGDYQNAALSGVAVLPGGSILKNGIKAGRTSSKFLKGTGKSGKGLTKIDDHVDLTGFRKDHILNRHRAGAGKGKDEFPSSWSDERILHQISDIATDPKAVTGVGKWNSPYAIGIRDGVEIRVDFYPTTHPNHAGKISTSYPLGSK